MPLYEFECKDCKHKFSDVTRYEEKPPKCTKCQSANVLRLISAPGIRFIGPDWQTSSDPIIGS